MNYSDLRQNQQQQQQLLNMQQQLLQQQLLQQVLGLLKDTQSDNAICFNELRSDINLLKSQMNDLVQFVNTFTDLVVKKDKRYKISEKKDKRNNIYTSDDSVSFSIDEEEKEKEKEKVKEEEVVIHDSYNTDNDSINDEERHSEADSTDVFNEEEFTSGFGLEVSSSPESSPFSSPLRSPAIYKEELDESTTYESKTKQTITFIHSDMKFYSNALQNNLSVTNPKWISEKVIFNAILSFLKIYDTQSKIRVLGSLHVNHSFESSEMEPLQNLDYYFSVIPYQLNKAHWILLIADHRPSHRVSSGTVIYYIDPIRRFNINSNHQNHRLYENIKHLFRVSRFQEVSVFSDNYAYNFAIYMFALIQHFMRRISLDLSSRRDPQAINNNTVPFYFADIDTQNFNIREYRDFIAGVLKETGEETIAKDMKQFDYQLPILNRNKPTMQTRSAVTRENKQIETSSIFAHQNNKRKHHNTSPALSTPATTTTTTTSSTNAPTHSTTITNDDENRIKKIKINFVPKNSSSSSSSSNSNNNNNNSKVFTTERRDKEMEKQLQQWRLITLESNRNLYLKSKPQFLSEFTIEVPDQEPFSCAKSIVELVMSKNESKCSIIKRNTSLEYQIIVSSMLMQSVRCKNSASKCSCIRHYFDSKSNFDNYIMVLNYYCGKQILDTTKYYSTFASVDPTEFENWLDNLKIRISPTEFDFHLLYAIDVRYLNSGKGHKELLITYPPVTEAMGPLFYHPIWINSKSLVCFDKIYVHFCAHKYYILLGALHGIYIR